MISLRLSLIKQGGPWKVLSLSLSLSLSLRRGLKGQHDQVQQDREPLRGKSASERESFQVFRSFQRFSEVF